MAIKKYTTQDVVACIKSMLSRKQTVTVKSIKVRIKLSSAGIQYHLSKLSKSKKLVRDKKTRKIISVR